MNLNPNKWSCVPTAISNVIGLPVAYFIECIGHDGSSFPYEDYPEQRRGFCISECVDVLSSLGFAMTAVVLEPLQVPAEDGIGIPLFKKFPSDAARLLYHLGSSSGVLTGTLDDGTAHCVSWFGGRIHDPRGVGRVYLTQDFKVNGFDPEVFYKIQQVMP